MKKFTIGFVALLVIAVAGAPVFVALSPDFVEPVRQAQEGIPEDHPIWDKTLDDLAAYLVEKGMIPSVEYDTMAGGIATEARRYSGIGLYWWDVDHLEEGSPERKAYREAAESGQIDLYGSGVMMSVGLRGPFAYNSGYFSEEFSGDPDALEKAFNEFCAE